MSGMGKAINGMFIGLVVVGALLGCLAAFLSRYIPGALRWLAQVLERLAG